MISTINYNRLRGCLKVRNARAKLNRMFVAAYSGEYAGVKPSDAADLVLMAAKHGTTVGIYESADWVIGS